MINLNHIPDYLKSARLNMLSKTDLAQVEVDQIRPITKLLHTLKVIEKAIKAKAEELGYGLF